MIIVAGCAVRDGQARPGRSSRAYGASLQPFHDDAATSHSPLPGPIEIQRRAGPGWSDASSGACKEAETDPAMGDWRCGRRRGRAGVDLDLGLGCQLAIAVACSGRIGRPRRRLGDRPASLALGQRDQVGH